MSSKAREYTRATIRKLGILSGNQCYAPNCNNPLIAKEGMTGLSQIAHIEAASSKGPRFNADMKDDDRRHFNNLILLCDTCHKIIDNKENKAKYPVTLLREWKKNHEARWQQGRLIHAPSLLSLAINKVAEIDFEESISLGDAAIPSFSINEKIKHNAIKRNKALIEEYRVFHAKIDVLYAEIEKQGSFKKEKLLRNIRNMYLKVKGRYVLDATNPIEIIRSHADDIIEEVEDQLLNQIIEDSKDQDVAFEISLIMVDAFMRCKIMEEVPVA